MDSRFPYCYSLIKLWVQRVAELVDAVDRDLENSQYIAALKCLDHTPKGLTTEAVASWKRFSVGEEYLLLYKKAWKELTYEKNGVARCRLDEEYLFSMHYFRIHGDELFSDAEDQLNRRNLRSVPSSLSYIGFLDNVRFMEDFAGTIPPIHYPREATLIEISKAACECADQLCSRWWWDWMSSLAQAIGEPSDSDFGAEDKKALYWVAYSIVHSLGRLVKKHFPELREFLPDDTRPKFPFDVEVQMGKYIKLSTLLECERKKLEDNQEVATGHWGSVTAPTEPADEIELICEKLSGKQEKLFRFLVTRKHPTSWDSLPPACFREGIEPSDPAIHTALKRLKAALDKNPSPLFELSISKEKRKVALNKLGLK